MGYSFVCNPIIHPGDSVLLPLWGLCEDVAWLAIAVLGEAFYCVVVADVLGSNTDWLDLGIQVCVDGGLISRVCAWMSTVRATEDPVAGVLVFVRWISEMVNQNRDGSGRFRLCRC